MIKLYRHPLSGHTHRIELMLSLLKLEFELIDIDLAAGEHKQEAFLAKNPFGQVPVLEDGDVTIWDSNAILVYLARTYGNSSWLPLNPIEEAKVASWLSVAASKIANGPASARLVTVFGAGLDHENAKKIAYDLFDVMEGELANRQFLVGNTPTIADVAGYSYISHAPEGGVSLEAYPNIQAWLGRIEALDGFVPMQQTAAGLRAA